MIKHWPQENFLIVLCVLHLGLALPVMDVSDPGMPFQLTVTPAFANRFTTNNMTLRCERNPSVQTKMAEISRMRILKQSYPGWDLIAEKRDILSSPTVSVDATASASVTSDIANIFLQVTWDNIDRDNFGVYKCEVMGFHLNAAAAMESSGTIQVDEGNNLVAHVLGISKDAQQHMEEIQKSTDTKIARLQKGLSEVKTFLSSLTQWPGGYYALLQPKTGCPVDLAFFGGTHKFHKIHTETQYSTNETNRYSYIFSSMISNSEGGQNFFTMEFCEVTKQFNRSSWPQGVFCIHGVQHKPCPFGFDYGRAYLDTENSDPSGEARNNVASGPNNIHLYFCCQNSSSAREPIQLPTSSPFLLYRYGGECQSVQGMSVSEEFIQINTEDSSNFDFVSGSHPDVDQPGSVMKFHLCYYS